MILQLTKILVNDHEFINLLDSNFELNLEHDWIDNKIKYTGNLEYVQDNKMFITEIYFNNKLVWDIKQKQKEEIDQYTNFINQELNNKEKIKWKLKPCPSCKTFKKNNLIDTTYEDYCSNCKLYHDMVDEYEELENQEIAIRDNILNYEYHENIRILEPHKNKYCIKKFVTRKEYDHYDEKLEKSVYTKQRFEIYKFKCGREYPTALNTLNEVTKNHMDIEKCLACRILTGESKRQKGFRQDEVSLLFSKNVTNLESSSGNLKSRQNTIMHYSTIECIRTIYNEIIDNTQCWSAGFASCPKSYGKYDLPLTTLNRLDFDIYNIKILDQKDTDLLFMVTSNDDKLHHTLLYGRDDNQNFLVEIDSRDPYNPKAFIRIDTLKQAYESMIPIEARKKKYIRQGDLFFIPIKPITIKGKKIKMLEKFLQYKKQEYESIPVRYDRYLSSTEQQNLEKNYYDKLNVYHNWRYGWDPFKDCISGLLAENMKREFIDKTDHHKTLRRLQIFDTNHETSEMCISKNGKYTYVRGQVIHRNRQHQKLKLDDWHMVLRNRVKQAFVIERFGGFGGD